MTRYGIALIVACANVGTGLFICFIISRWTKSFEGYDVEVSADQMRLIFLADLLSHYWFVWIPLSFATCLGIAWIMGLAARRG